MLCFVLIDSVLLNFNVFGNVLCQKKGEKKGTSHTCTLTTKCPTHLIVGGEDKLKDDEQSDQGGLCLKAKRLVQNGFVQQQRKHQEAEERVHLQTHTSVSPRSLFGASSHKQLKVL